MAQWITRLPTEQKIPGSSPGRVVLLFYVHRSNKGLIDNKLLLYVLNAAIKLCTITTLNGAYSLLEMVKWPL